MSGNYFAQTEASQGIFVDRILVKIAGIKLHTTFAKLGEIPPAWMVPDGSRWFWMVLDGSRWFQMILVNLDGFTDIARVLIRLYKYLDVLLLK